MQGVEAAQFGWPARRSSVEGVRIRLAERPRNTAGSRRRWLFMDNGLLALLVEVAQPRGFTNVCGLDADQIGLPGGGSDSGVAPGADGVDGAIAVHPVWKSGRG